MRFSYKNYGGIFRPVIPIKLRNGGREIGYEVLVDSGADFCVFDAEIGEVLGINVRKGKLREIFGIGGKVSLYYLHPVEMVIGKKTHKIEAGFMPNISKRIMPFGLVGQKGFFDNFIVRFDLRKGVIEVKNNS